MRFAGRFNQKFEKSCWKKSFVFAGLYRKVKRVLSELLAEHWGEMICQTNSATVSSRYTQLFQDGIMPTPAQLNNRPTSGIDRLQQDFLDLGKNQPSSKY